MPALERLTPQAREAWTGSLLSHFTEPATERLLATAREVRVPANEIVLPSSGVGRADFLALVVEGLLRVYVQAGARQVTVHYIGPGDLPGLFPVLRDGITAQAQSLTPCLLLRISGEALRAAVLEDTRNAWALSQELVRLNIEAIELLSANVFAPVRQRVARHLLDLAAREHGRFVVRASHQDVADAIGTVREVVSRVLTGLRRDGLVVRDDRAMIICDLDALHRIASGHGART